MMACISDITYFNNNNKNGPFRGKVMTKSNLGTYQHPHLDGEAEEMFSCMLRDEHGSDIEVSIFGDNARKLYPVMKLSNDYQINCYDVSNADARYNFSGHKCRLVVNDASAVIESLDELKVKPLDFKLTPISSFNSKVVEGPVNVLGVVVECEEVETAFVKGSRDESVRGIHVADGSGYRIRVKLWAHNAEDFVYDERNRPIVLVCGVRQESYQGKCFLATGMSSMIIVNPTDVMNPKDIKSIKNKIEDLQQWKEDGVTAWTLNHCLVTEEMRQVYERFQ